jgi:hypothetical protein
MEHFRLVDTIPKEQLVEKNASANEKEPEPVSLSYNSAHDELFYVDSNNRVVLFIYLQQEAEPHVEPEHWKTIRLYTLAKLRGTGKSICIGVAYAYARL